MVAAREVEDFEATDDLEAEEDEMSLLDTGRTEERDDARALGKQRFSGRGFRLVAALGLIALTIPALVAMSRRSPSPSQPRASQRLLESEDLLDLVVGHAVRFNEEAGGASVDISDADTNADLRQEASRQVREMLDKVSRANPEAGRLMSDVHLTPEQWSQSKSILNALHDKRVLEMGTFVRKAVSEGKSQDEVEDKIATRADEIRKLRDELIPEDLQNVAEQPDGQNHWGFAMEKAEFSASAKLGAWQGSLEVGGESSEKPLAARRLVTAQQLYVIIGASVALVLGIVSTVLTAVFGPGGAMLFWIITAGIDGLLCAGSIGFTLMPGFENVQTWIPCMILTHFVGMEAIWTFIKQGKGGGTTAAAGAAGAATTAAPAAAAR